MHYLNPHTAPIWVAAIVLALVLYGLFHLARQLYRAWMDVRAEWKKVDEAHFQAIRRDYQKAHESEGRSF